LASCCYIGLQLSERTACLSGHLACTTSTSSKLRRWSSARRAVPSCGLRAFFYIFVLGPRLWKWNYLPRLLRDTSHNTTSFGHSLKTFFSQSTSALAIMRFTNLRFTYLLKFVSSVCVGCSGVAVAGSGIGTFVFAPLTDWLLTNFLWRGALLICSAIMLNVVVCGAVFRPLRARSRSSLRRLSTTPADLIDVQATESERLEGHARWSAAGRLVNMASISTSNLYRERSRSRIGGSANLLSDRSSSNSVSVFTYLIH